jgi:hypothetical protein
MASNTFNTLHYGGSLRAKGSTTPGISPAPARRPGRPSQNTSFQAQKRFEMIARMENAGMPESAIAPMLGISVSRLRYLKKMPEYLIVRMSVTHGIILDHESKVKEIKEQRKEMLVNLLPAALQTVANTLLTQPANYAEKKLQVDVAKDVLDRSDIFAKVSRTEIKPVSFFDFEKSDKESADVMRILKAVSSAPQVPNQATKAVNPSSLSSSSIIEVEALLADFSGGAGLSSEEQQQALDSLESSEEIEGA